jgi:hypothetical protein
MEYYADRKRLKKSCINRWAIISRTYCKVKNVKCQNVPIVYYLSCRYAREIKENTHEIKNAPFHKRNKERTKLKPEADYLWGVERQRVEVEGMERKQFFSELHFFVLISFCRL